MLLGLGIFQVMDLSPDVTSGITTVFADRLLFGHDGSPMRLLQCTPIPR